MKKIVLIIAIVLSYATIAQCQNTCISANNIFYSSDSVPPIGTVSPSGPDYGCLSMTTRQIWYYIPICQNTFLYSIDVYAPESNDPSDDSIGMIFYGPFSQKITNCSDLSSNKILHCDNQNYPGIYTLNCIDSVYQGSYYYLLLTFSDSIPTGPVLVVPDFSPASLLDCFECNNQVSVLYRNNLCLVTVDTAINKCHLTWEEFPGTNLLGYNIYRQSFLTGQLDSIATVPVGSLSEYTDMSSSPASHNYTYDVRGVDSCGNSYPAYLYSTTLTSMHLLSFPGGNNQAQLIWNDIYNTNTNLYVPEYFVFRNSNGTGWQQIDSLAAFVATMTYTDISAPAGVNQYAVALQSINACVPMRTTSSGGQLVFSNTTTTLVTGYEQLTNNAIIGIYPNPAKNKFTIDLSNFNSFPVDVSIIDLQGRKVFENKNYRKNQLVYDAENLSSGIYVVEVKGEKVYRNKLVIE